MCTLQKCTFQLSPRTSNGSRGLFLRLFQTGAALCAIAVCLQPFLYLYILQLAQSGELASLAALSSFAVRLGSEPEEAGLCLICLRSPGWSSCHRPLSMVPPAEHRTFLWLYFLLLGQTLKRLSLGTR